MNILPRRRGRTCSTVWQGAYNYHFTDDGRPEVFCSLIPDKELMLRIHRACYRIHERLLQESILRQT